MYGPKGVGALYVRRKPRVRLVAQMDGGGHERGFRSGTLNVPGIVGFGKAAELAAAERDAEAARLLGLRERLRKGILAGLDLVTLNGSLEHRLPGSLNLSFAYVEGEAHGSRRVRHDCGVRNGGGVGYLIRPRSRAT